MRDKIKVVLKNGTIVTLDEWQKIYGLKVGSDKLGMHFSFNEPKFAQDLKDYGELVVNELLITVLDAFRERLGENVNINAFNRNDAKQEKLIKAGYRAAVFSPHVVKMAADIDTISEEQTYEWVKILKEVAKELNIKIRIGYQDYLKNGQTFIHLDVCPEFYATGKPFNKINHPAAWEMAICW